MPYRLIIMILITFLMPFTAYASDVPECAQEHVPDAATVGKGTYKVMMWNIYDSALFAPNGTFSNQKPYALTLEYHRVFEGNKIADTSVQEMRKNGFKDEVKLASWHSEMRRIFPDVNKGDTLTGISLKNGTTLFCHGDTEIGTVEDTEFGKKFFGMWLSETTSAPSLRSKLLGNQK